MATFEKGHTVLIRSHAWGTGLRDSRGTDDSFSFWSGRSGGERGEHRQMLHQGQFPQDNNNTGTDPKEQTPNTEKCFMCKTAVIEYFYNSEKY